MVERDVPGLMNQRREPLRRPEFGGEAMLQGALGQPTPDDLLLSVVEVRWSSQCRFGFQAALPFGLVGRYPSSDRSRRDFQNLRDLIDGMATVNAAEGQQATPFKFCRTARGSHATADSKHREVLGHYFPDRQ